MLVPRGGALTEKVREKRFFSFSIVVQYLRYDFESNGLPRQARDKRKENSTKRGWRSALHTQGTPGSKWPISDYRDSYFEDNCYWEEGGRERKI